MLFLLFLFHVAVGSLVDCPDPSNYAECGRCSSTDDPHILTFDDLYYDQHTDSCFKYVTACPGSPDYLPFEVCGCHYDCGSLGGTGADQNCPGTIRCIGEITLSFYAESDPVNPSFLITIDFTTIAPAIDANTGALSPGSDYTFSPEGHKFHYYSPDGIQHFFTVTSGAGAANQFYGYVRYSPGNLEVLLNPEYFANGNICGLCGLFDLDQYNDFLGSDNTEYLNTTDIDTGLSIGAVPPVINQKVNDFAETWLCDPMGPSPFDPTDLCTLDPAYEECVENYAEACCQQLWDDTLGGAWDNPIVNPETFLRNWLLGCARDACALMAPNFDPVKQCDFSSGAFDFAAQIAKETAFQEYPLPQEKKSNCTAKVCAHGDNRIVMDVSYDGGATWVLGFASETSWTQTMGGGFVNVNPVDENTVLRFTVSDVGVVGGFLATVRLCGDNGYIFEFFTDQVNTFFDVISETPNGDTLIDAFTPFGGTPWGGFVNPKRVECMNTDADWIWNDRTYNAMVFELDFGHHIDFLKKAECYEEQPDPVPTQDDCCKLFTGLEEFADKCYCDSSSTGGTVVVGPVGTVSDVAQLSKAQFSAAKTVTGNQLGDVGQEVGNDVLMAQMLKDMKQFKTMMFVTMMMIAGSFVVLFGMGYECQCQKKKKGFKRVSDSDDEL